MLSLAEDETDLSPVDAPSTMAIATETKSPTPLPGVAARSAPGGNRSDFVSTFSDLLQISLQDSAARSNQGSRARTADSKAQAKGAAGVSVRKQTPADAALGTSSVAASILTVPPTSSLGALGDPQAALSPTLTIPSLSSQSRSVSTQASFSEDAQSPISTAIVSLSASNITTPSANFPAPNPATQTASESVPIPAAVTAGSQLQATSPGQHQADSVSEDDPHRVAVPASEAAAVTNTLASSPPATPTDPASLLSPAAVALSPCSGEPTPAWGELAALEGWASQGQHTRGKPESRSATAPSGAAAAPVNPPLVVPFSKKAPAVGSPLWQAPMSANTAGSAAPSGPDAASGSENPAGDLPFPTIAAAGDHLESGAKQPAPARSATPQADLTPGGGEPSAAPVSSSSAPSSPACNPPSIPAAEALNLPATIPGSIVLAVADSAGSFQSTAALASSLPSHSSSADAVRQQLAEEGPVLSAGLQAWNGGEHLQGDVALASHLAGTAGQSEMNIAMQAEALGAVQVRTHVSGDQVQAAITVERRDAHAVLSSDLPALHQALNDRQLRLEGISVSQASFAGGTAISDGTGRQHPQDGTPQHPFSAGSRFAPDSKAPESLGSTEPSDARTAFDSHGRLSVRA